MEQFPVAGWEHLLQRLGVHQLAFSFARLIFEHLDFEVARDRLVLIE